MHHQESRLYLPPGGTVSLPGKSGILDVDLPDVVILTTPAGEQSYEAQS